MDKVVREMCHFDIRMVDRGVGRVYRIVKSPYQGFTYTPFLGTIYLEMPPQKLEDEFRRLHAEHQERLYASSLRKMEASAKMDTERVDKALTPVETQESLIDKAKLILPQIVDIKKDTDQGLINFEKLKETLNLPHSKAYSLRQPYWMRFTMITTNC